MDPELWGHGYILQIQEILKQHVFEVLELNRLYGVTMITNQRTISSLLSCGMRNEGVSREFYCKNGAYIDGWRYAMLRNDYFRTKELPLPLDCMCTIDDVVNIVQSVLTEEKITHESTMRTVMSWDSLNHMSIMIAVTEKTGVSLSPSEMMRANSVATLRSILANRGGRN